MIRRQKLTVVAQDCRLDPEDVAHAIVAQGEWTVIEKNLGPHARDVRRRMKRQRMIASIENGDANDVDLNSCLGSLFLSNCPHDLDCIVELQMLRMKVVGRADALNKS